MVAHRFPLPGTPPEERMRYYPGVSPAIPHRSAGCSRVPHPFAGCSELPPSPHDLHVLSTPPAFVLSQDQTLQETLISSTERDRRTDPTITSGIMNVRESISRRGTRSPRLKREPSHNITHSIVKQRAAHPRSSGEREM